MFFKKKKKDSRIECDNCNSKISEKYSFCPYCGDSMTDDLNDQEDYGLLGKKDMVDEELAQNAMLGGFNVADKLIGSLMQNLVKNLESQFKEMDKSEIKSHPNGIRIKLGPHPAMKQNQPQKQKIVNRPITSKQIERIGSLPKVEAKTNIKRLSDKVLYEFSASGVSSPEDVLVSKLESGYEVKAIGKTKVYTGSCPVNLPLKGFSLSEKGIVMEFTL